MKRFILAALLCTMSLPAFANDEVVDVTDETALMTPMYDESEAAAEDFDAMTENFDAQSDANLMPPPRRPGPGRGRWVYTCYARNILHKTFWARSRNQWEAQDRVMHECRRSTRVFRCDFLGCERDWARP